MRTARSCQIELFVSGFPEHDQHTPNPTVQRSALSAAPHRQERAAEIRPENT